MDQSRVAGPYAAVVGEALVDLLESGSDSDRIYRPHIGGAPLNVAVGLARLGDPAELIGAVGADVLGQRVRDFLTRAGVGTSGLLTVPGPTSLALTTFEGSEPTFQFYGAPPSYSMVSATDLDLDLIAGAAVLYCGSISLLVEPSLSAARAAWAVPGPLRTIDPNVRPALMGDPAGFRAVVEEFAATADLVKLSALDAAALFDTDPAAAATHLRAIGAGTVVVTLGAAGALLATQHHLVRVGVPAVRAVDATGAGDATMAGLLHGLLGTGLPDTVDGWTAALRFAATVGALACESPGGATAMPSLAVVLARLGN